MAAAVTLVNTIPFPARGSDRPSLVAGWNHRAMETQLFLVGYDRLTGFAKAFYRLPDPAPALSISGLTSAPIGDQPLTPAQAERIAALIGTPIDTEGLEFCLEPHQPLEAAEAPKASVALTTK